MNSGDFHPTILLTRDERSNVTAAAAMERRGLRCHCIPMIRIAEPSDWKRCDRAIAELSFYDGVVFTSRHAATIFIDRVEHVAPDKRSILASTPTYAVGIATAAALTAAALRTMEIPEPFSSEHLAAAIGAGAVREKRFLFPCSDIARPIIPEVLRQLGATVDDVVVYRNLPPAQEEAERLRELFRTTPPDAVVFFSPSAVRNFCSIIRPADIGQTAVAVIGSTTETEAGNNGLKVTVRTDRASTESVADSLHQYFHPTSK